MLVKKEYKRQKNNANNIQFSIFVKFSLVTPSTLNNLGDTLRQLRDSKGLLLRQVAADLDMDTALLSKIERGERIPKKEQVLKAAEIFDVPSKDLLVVWLAEKITQLLVDEPLALEALDKCRTQLKKGKATDG